MKRCKRRGSLPATRRREEGSEDTWEWVERRPASNPSSRGVAEEEATSVRRDVTEELIDLERRTARNKEQNKKTTRRKQKVGKATKKQ